MVEIREWLADNQITHQLQGNHLSIPDFGECLVLETKERQFDDEFFLCLTEDELNEAEDMDYIVYQFGKRWYYTNEGRKPKFIELKHVGKVETILTNVDFPFVGIHGGYDLCNGSRLYEDWVKKAKFLGTTTLGICEENTLAGVIPFQQACEKAELKSVIGENIIVRGPEGDYTVKLYCRDRDDWENLLVINKITTVDNKNFITEEELLNNCFNLIMVLTPDIQLSSIYEKYKDVKNLYYQLDFTEWASQTKDTEWLENLYEYLKDYLDIVRPVLINDAYYLDKEDSHIRRLLNTIGHVKFKNQSKNQYFKSIDDYFMEGIEMFKEEDTELCENIIIDAIMNTVDAFEGIDFKILTGEFYLPKYKMTEEEASQFDTNEELLYSFMEKGMISKVQAKGKNELEYWERVEKEMEVIRKGKFVDYFLIFADIYKFCDENNIWYGIGRGSAAGCMVAYLCDIVDVDPIQFKLIFERFLNEGRLGKSLPDIDGDFQGDRRPDIKKYIQDKYGYDYVTSIGTYSTFKLKNGVKDVARVKGVPGAASDYVTHWFPEPQQQTAQHVSELFHQCKEASQVYDYVQKFPQVANDLPLLLAQPKNSSIHAAGVVIVPKEFGTVYEQMPVKQQDGMLVSQWEGHYIDDAGFLKLDILGIRQLDKFSSINKLIIETGGKDIRFKHIQLDDQKVFDLFRKGYTEDVFQFGASGLKAYCKQLQPDDIEDLIATVALYRPGPIESGTHVKYIKRKNGVDDVEYDPDCEEIESTTYGLIVYQEQVMQIVQKLANFTLVEADDIRKALGKMKPEIVKGYRDIFLDRVRDNGYDMDEMETLWKKMEAFAAYAFNRSHAACYAITGYYSQWFKVHYPLQFWTVSLQYSEDKKIPNRISEIKNTTNINISSVDVNYSHYDYRMDKDNNSIYWSLPSVKFVGEAAVKDIFTERETNGLFYSLEEFVERMSGNRGINVRAISNLIICGAFDTIADIDMVEKRFHLLKELFEIQNRKEKDFLEKYDGYDTWEEHEWMLLQKSLCGYGDVDFKKIIDNSILVDKSHIYRTNTDILQYDAAEERRLHCIACGVLESRVERKSRNGVFAELQIRDNSDLVYVTVWTETYDEYKDELKDSLGKVIMVTGHIQVDNYKKLNVIQTNKTTKIVTI